MTGFGSQIFGWRWASALTAATATAATGAAVGELHADDAKGEREEREPLTMREAPAKQQHREHCRKQQLCLVEHLENDNLQVAKSNEDGEVLDRVEHCRYAEPQGVLRRAAERIAQPPERRGGAEPTTVR